LLVLSQVESAQRAVGPTEEEVKGILLGRQVKRQKSPQEDIFCREIGDPEGSTFFARVLTGLIISFGSLYVSIA